MVGHECKNNYIFEHELFWTAKAVAPVFPTLTWLNVKFGYVIQASLFMKKIKEMFP